MLFILASFAHDTACGHPGDNNAISLVKVEQNDTDARCVYADQPEPVSKKAPRFVMQFATTGKEVAYPLGEATKKIAKWEGSALMVNKIVSGSPRSYTQMDVGSYRVMAQHSHPTADCDAQGEMESTLVYARP